MQERREGYVFWAPEDYTVDVGDAGEAEGDEGLAGFALCAGLDLVESGVGGGVFLMLVVRVVGGDLFDVGGHLWRLKWEVSGNYLGSGGG